MGFFFRDLTDSRLIPTYCCSLVSMSKEELQAQDLVQRGEIDQAIIATYQQLKPESARILRIIGALYDEKKGDYSIAINYYEKALQIQEKVYRYNLILN
jgi:tetratricopeptide (TPR) repeat protein